MKYVDSRVWLKVPGGVEGWDVDELNKRIDQWNSPNNAMVRSLGNFFDWLSYEEGRYIYGFDFLWHSKQLSKLHRING